MAMDVTHAFLEGKTKSQTNPYQYSSPSWMGYEAGRAMRHIPEAHICKMSLGYSVRVKTRKGGVYVVKFSGDKWQNVTVEQKA